ncbi:MAG: hypothetical protein ACR2NP_07400 [Pirellulaceae bacterium]
MNEQNTPMLAENAKAAGLVLARTDEDIARSVDKSALGMACVELIGQLENVFARAREQSLTDYIDEAAETARKMLELLEGFSKAFLDGGASNQAGEEITKALMCSHAYDEVLKTRPLGNALLRAFWKADETDSIKEAHVKLGDNIIRATAATLYHAIMMLGFDSDMGGEIDQSTVVFVTELNQSW